MLFTFIDTIGKITLSFLDGLGSFTLFFIANIGAGFKTRLKIKQVLAQIKHIGAESFAIVFLTGLFTGCALALQFYIGLKQFGGKDFIGLVIAAGMIRELGPVLTGLMVTGRAGSAMAAEIGTMKINEEIDALHTLRINPYQYLIIPRIIASMISLPLLAAISMLCGITGGYLYCVYSLDINADVYISSIRNFIELWDLIGGLIKSMFFGLILSFVGTYTGYNTTGGAQGVGIATTKSVMFGSIFILIANYFLSVLLFQGAAT